MPIIMKMWWYASLMILLFAAAARSQSGPSGSTVFVNEVGSTQLNEEGPLVPDDYSNPLFNDYGFVIRGNTTSGEDFMLWMFLYRQIGYTEFITNNDLCQTTLIHGTFTTAEKGVMNDTPFINVGQDIEDYTPIGTLKSSQNSSQVQYTFQGRILESGPQTWRAYGTHAGVEVALEMTQRGNEFYHAGLFSALTGCSPNTTSSNYNCSGVAGGVVHADVTGNFTTNGTTLTIDTAYAVHERIIQAGAVPSRLESGLGNGAFWLHGWGQQLSWFAFTADVGPYAVGMLNADNQTVSASGTANVSIAVTANWLDPKTNQANPYAWSTSIDLENGRLEATVSSFGRLYYYWVRNGGMLLVHQYIADCVTTFTRKDGSVVKENGVAFLEYIRTLYVQPNHVF